MSRTQVPKVDLLDIDREPTDEELEALMQDMIDHVRERGQMAHDAYMAEMYANIARASKTRPNRRARSELER